MIKRFSRDESDDVINDFVSETGGKIVCYSPITVEYGLEYIVQDKFSQGYRVMDGVSIYAQGIDLENEKILTKQGFLSERIKVQDLIIVAVDIYFSKNEIIILDSYNNVFKLELNKEGMFLHDKSKNKAYCVRYFSMGGFCYGIDDIRYYKKSLQDTVKKNLENIVGVVDGADYENVVNSYHDQLRTMHIGDITAERLRNSIAKRIPVYKSATKTLENTKHLLKVAKMYGLNGKAVTITKRIV